MTAYICRDVCDQIEELAPPHFALEGDPIGLHLGAYARPVKRLFLALELTPEVAVEAMEEKPDMIVVHHTPFFKPFRHLRDDGNPGALVIELIRRRISLYTAHTNLDCARGGVSDVLAGRLGISDTEILQHLNHNEAGAGLGRIGLLKEPAVLSDFAAFAGRALSAGGIRYCGDKTRTIRKVAVCGGAGAYLMNDAAARGADAFVTADVKHHEGAEALDLGIALIDAGHFATENPVIPVLASYLMDKLPELEVAVSKVNANPFLYV